MFEKSGSRQKVLQPEPSLLHTYRLKFSDDGLGLPKEIEFEAEDAAGALIIAHGEARNRSAELWRNGEKVCTIMRTRDDIWKISR
ncbi:MAG: hypothetical protein JY451_11305 [Erythrobacter sp.]|nr:MAG: hypothetical protein JY451_11305 [Erythrobacter sp.]